MTGVPSVRSMSADGRPEMTIVCYAGPGPDDKGCGEGGVPARAPRHFLGSAAAAGAESDAPFTMFICLPQNRHRGGHRNVPVTEYPQQ